MLNPNDVAKVIRRASNDLVKREMNDILEGMDPEAKVDFVNGVRCLNEVSEAIERKARANGGLVFMLVE